MKDADYIARLKRHLVAYKTGVLCVQESGVWGTPPRLYPHILPVDRRQLNIVAPLREAFWREQSRQRWRLHQYFHHLSSSQALAFNLLFPLYPQAPPRMTATRRALGLPVSGTCELRFEAVLDATEGTNIDALFSTAEDVRTIVEIKLTERTFGTAALDEPHLQKLAGTYVPRLRGRVSDSCLEPRTFFRDYQLYRNLAQIRPNSSDRVVLLLPMARTELWCHALSWCESPTLGSLREHIHVVALEDVIAAIGSDSVGIEQSEAAIAEVSEKYLLTVGEQAVAIMAG